MRPHYASRLLYQHVPPCESLFIQFTHGHSNTHNQHYQPRMSPWSFARAAQPQTAGQYSFRQDLLPGCSPVECLNREKRAGEWACVRTNQRLPYILSHPPPTIMRHRQIQYPKQEMAGAAACMRAHNASIWLYKMQCQLAEFHFHTSLMVIPPPITNSMHILHMSPYPR